MATDALTVRAAGSPAVLASETGTSNSNGHGTEVSGGESPQPEPGR
jgi:hypothetical protein